MALKKKIDMAVEDQREKLFLDIIGHLLRYNDQERKDIAKEAEVHWTTLYNWTHGSTINPHIRTLSSVARVMGYEIVLKRIRTPKAIIRRIK